MTTVHLIRHASAGSRSHWHDDDELRPLTDKGRRQAKALAAVVNDGTVMRIMSSEFVRCIETLAPLADATGLQTEIHDALREGASLTDTMKLIEAEHSGTTVICSHGDVIGGVIDHLARAGVDIDPHGGLQKASRWILDVRSGSVLSATYVAPPA